MKSGLTEKVHHREDTTKQKGLPPTFSDGTYQPNNLRLKRNPVFKNHYIFYCGVCKKNNFEEAAQLITHFRDVCKEKDKNSSHFLTSLDYKKEIIRYQMKEHSAPECLDDASSSLIKLVMSVLGTTLDHRDLPFECGACFQVFQAGQRFSCHVTGRHSEVIDPGSSHIILRFPRKVGSIYISDRIPWFNQDETSYCPCKPNKKMTMAKLIKHVRQVHMGISPFYRTEASDIPEAKDLCGGKSSN